MHKADELICKRLFEVQDFSSSQEPELRHWSNSLAARKRSPRNWISSPVEWNLSSLPESTSSTQPSKRFSEGSVSAPSRSTKAPRITMPAYADRTEDV